MVRKNCWMRRYLNITTVCCVLLLVFFAGFGRGDIQAADTVKIAAILEQTGKAATYGLSALEGVEVGVDEINRAGGIQGRPLQLVVIDNMSSPLGSKQAAKKAVDLGVSLVIGAVWSTHSLAMAPVLQEAGIPMISPGSTSPQVTHVGSFIFRTCYTDSFQGRLLAGFAYHELKARTAAVLTNLNETYSQDLASQFHSVFQQFGGKVVLAEGYKGSAVDFKGVLEAVRAQSPDVVFIPGYSKDSGFIIRQARAMGVDTVFIGGDAWEQTIGDYAGSGLEGSYYSTFWHPDLSSRESLHFSKAFTAFHGNKEISPYAALAYDAVNLFADAAGRAGSLAGGDIQEALQKTRGFKGATGSFAFDAFGDPLEKGATILKFVKGEWVLFKWVDPTAWQAKPTK